MLILKERLKVIFVIKVVSKGTSLIDHELSYVDLYLYLQLWSIYCLLPNEKNHVLKKKSKNKDTYPDHLGIKCNNCKIQNYCGKVHQIKVQKMEISNVKKKHHSVCFLRFENRKVQQASASVTESHLEPNPKILWK